MIQISWIRLFPILILSSIESCRIVDISQVNYLTDVIFTGRMLSIHQWSIGQPYSAFVWVFRIFRGEDLLSRHYQIDRLQYPFYIIVENLDICEETSPMKLSDFKIFGIRINNARFYSSFTPLTETVANLEAIQVLMSTVTNKSYVVAVDQHNHDKSRRLLRIILLFLGIIILLAAIFLAIVVYRTVKTGIQRKSSTTNNNLTDLISNQSLVDFQSERTCLYGRVACEFGATCTDQNQCLCVFNCNEATDFNSCQYNEEQCNSYYQQISSDIKVESACSSITCSHGSHCRIDNNGLAQCYCPDDCNEYGERISSDRPVCGTDNQTYENLCELKRKACQIQENLTVAYTGECQQCPYLNCSKIDPSICNPSIECLSESNLLCASNLEEYSNECQMNKYACQLNIRLTKLHDGPCDVHEQQQKMEACKALICFNGKICMIENGIGVCRCLFNCSTEENQVCGSNGILYRNLCELERDHCQREQYIVPVDSSYCLSTCDTLQCPYGQCIRTSSGQAQCLCQQCSQSYTDQDTVCGNNGFSYSSICHIEYDACTRHDVNLKPIHMGQCNNCHNITCPFNGQCQSQQGNYTCICPTRDTCPPLPTDQSYSICASNQEIFPSQCEMNIRSCELRTHLYAIAPDHCKQDKQQSADYTRECAYDEPLFDAMINRNIECDTLGRCPMNSYCNTVTNRCCVKIITAILPYRMCSSDDQCGKNMVCLSGLCECQRQDFIPARNKRECIATSSLPIGSSCSDSPYGCCQDNITVSPSINRRGCPEYCNCHPAGSLQLSCDPMTNSCYCRPAVGGTSCSHCENEYWGFSRILTHNNTGCTPCGCHPYGSTRKDCLQDTGECTCHSFATGRQCDKCIDSSLTLTERGCIDLHKGRRRPRTCRDFVCSFGGICQMINGHPRCTCHHVACTGDEQRLMDICASDGRTYKSKCAIKRQQCIKQYEIGLIYPGVCTATDTSSKEYAQIEEEFIPHEEEIAVDYPLEVVQIDSKRCSSNADCGENMVCLSEFCECAKQKYKRIPGPRCIAPHSNVAAANFTLNPVRRTTIGACLRRTPCENHATCIDRPDGNYKCLCAFGWQGRHCNEKFEVTIPHFNRHSYFELKTQISSKHNDNQLLRIDLIFATENPHGLLLYADDKLTEFYFIISLRNQILDITIRLDHFISTIQLPELIELDTYARLQVHILHNEIRARLNDGNISSRLLPFGSSFKSTLYLGGLPESFQSLYQQFHLNEGFQGCIHELSINERRIVFNNSEHHTILSAQNIDECIANPCRSGIGACRNGTRCIPIRNNDANSYKCLCNDHLSSLNTDCLISSIDRCSINPCDYSQQCINVYPNNYTCICKNCSTDQRYIAAFDSNSYIKRPPLQLIEQARKLTIEIWFLSESPSGLLIYSDHVNSKKGYFTIYLQRRIIICNLMMGNKLISLSSRYPIEMYKWHRCILELHGQKLVLIVDHEAPVVTYELFSSHLFSPRSFTFIGNLPVQYRSFDMLSNAFIFEGFRGAIQKIILNNQTLDDIRQDAIELHELNEYHGYPCHPNPCSVNQICQQNDLNNYTCSFKSPTEFHYKESSIEFDGKENLMYSYLPMNLNRNYFKLSFKTKISHGLIFYLGETTTTNVFSQYLSLTIVNGFVQFTAKIDRNSSETFLRSKIRVDDGQWHRIEIGRYRRRISMKLDNNYPRQQLLSGLVIDFRPYPSYIYLGGYHRLCGYNEQHCRTYRGCLKNFFLDKYFLDLINDEINQYYPLKTCQNP